MLLTTMIHTILIVILIASLQGVLGGRSGLTQLYVMTIPSLVITLWSKQQFTTTPEWSAVLNELPMRSQSTQDSRCGCLHTISLFNHAHGRWGEVIGFNKDNWYDSWRCFSYRATHTWWVCKLHLWMQRWWWFQWFQETSHSGVWRRAHQSRDARPQVSSSQETPQSIEPTHDFIISLTRRSRLLTLRISRMQSNRQTRLMAFWVLWLSTM